LISALLLLLLLLLPGTNRFLKLRPSQGRCFVLVLLLLLLVMPARSAMVGRMSANSDNKKQQR
jgi:hypothetical protein